MGRWGDGEEAIMEARGFVRDHEKLDVYREAFGAAMRLFELSRGFPVEERYALTDQVRRSSRSVCANLAEAWRKRRYAAAFVAKLGDAEAEAAETQTWIRFGHACGYLDEATAAELADHYDKIVAMLVKMIRRPEPWLLK
jgi:four helix bundle protein